MRRESLAVCERVYGKDHPGTMSAAYNLTVSLYQLGTALTNKEPAAVGAALGLCLETCL